MVTLRFHSSDQELYGSCDINNNRAGMFCFSYSTITGGMKKNNLELNAWPVWAQMCVLGKQSFCFKKINKSVFLRMSQLESSVSSSPQKQLFYIFEANDIKVHLFRFFRKIQLAFIKIRAHLVLLTFVGKTPHLCQVSVGVFVTQEHYICCENNAASCLTSPH